MGKASCNLNNRLKALALDRRKNQNNKNDDFALDLKDKIADAKAKMRQCERDIEAVGESNMIRQKIAMYQKDIKIWEKQLE